MSSLKKQIEDAVVTILNSGSFSQEFTAVRGPKSRKTLEQATALQVVVAAVPVSRKRLTRGKIEWVFGVGVGLFKNIGFTDEEVINSAALEEIDALAEEIADAMDVDLVVADTHPNGPLVPEIDYEADDGAFYAQGCAAVTITTPFIFWVNR